MSNIFEQASRQKLRFSSARGLLTVEDLWDLPLAKGQVNLNEIAIDVNRQLKDVAEESFVPAAKKADTAATKKLSLQLDILKHVIAVKLDEQTAREQAAAKAEQRATILAALQESQASALKGKTPEELQAMYDALG